MVIKLLTRGAVCFALAGLSQGVNLGYRPNPEQSPWADKEQAGGPFENSPWSSERA